MKTLRALEVKSHPGSTQTTSEISTVLVEGQLLDTAATVLDEDVLTQGARIRLPYPLTDVANRPIQEVHLPPLGGLSRLYGMVFINELCTLANAIVRAIEEGADRRTLQRTVFNFQTSLIKHLAGKKGLLARGCLGTRLPHSGRLVLTPSIHRHPGDVGLCRRAMRRAGIADGDYVLVAREPVIWHGSVAILQARPISQPVAQLHPLLYEGMGADNDGDQILFWCPDQKNAAVRAELEAHHLDWTRQHARWPAMLCPDGLPEEPDWDMIQEDTWRRFPVGGTYSPRDVLSPGRLTRELEARTKRSWIEQNRAIVDGEDNQRIMIDTVNDQICMKRELGLVGAISRRLLLLAGSDPLLVDGAHYLSEKLQQMKFDAKHGVKINVEDLVALFEQRGRWARASLDAMVQLMVDSGSEESKVRPVLAYLFIETPAVAALRYLGVDPLPDVRAAIVAGNLSATLLEACRRQNIAPKQLAELIREMRYGLSDLARLRFPGFSLTTARSVDDAVGLYHQLVIQGHRDPSGLYVQAEI